MRNLSATMCVLLVLVAGCDPAPSERQQRIASLSINGYNFALEYPEGADLKHDSTSEEIKIVCGQQVLRIADGKMTLNGADRGAVKQGDSIKLTSAGKLWVNQEPRGE